MKRLVFLFGACIISTCLFAQDNKMKQVVPASPNAAALGKYGDFPVSYHTGVPEISIPITTVKEGSISLPITLNYHSSGIKVDELASWVGLGWSLNAGGVITRSVVGAPDEGNSRSPINGDLFIRAGWLKNHGIDASVKDNCLDHPDGLPGDPAAWSNCMIRMMDVYNGVFDTEPDIYNFNFAGFSGKFIFDEAGNAVMMPRQDLIIKPILGAAVPNQDYLPLDRWMIIAPDGTRFYFGGTSAIENSYFEGTGVNCCAPNQISSTSWYLTKVVNLNKTDSIMFTYASEKYSFTNRPSHSVMFNAGVGGPPFQGDYINAPGYANITGIDGVRLSKITTGTGFTTVDFIGDSLRQDVSKFATQGTANDQAMRLARIQITTPGNQTAFNFGYSYFLSDINSSVPNFGGVTTQDMKRLRLDYVQESAGVTLKPPHRFDYNLTPMPRRLSLDRDHWGYYNKSQTYNYGSYGSNRGLIANFTLPGWAPFTGLAVRDPNEISMQAGILMKITYPTGGNTQFVYEAHRLDDNTLIGGLRIKQIVSTDGAGVPVVKNYSYYNGILYAGMPQYVVPLYNNPSYPSPGDGLHLGTRISSDATPALKTTQGYHIGYSSVTVTYPGNGKSVHLFRNLSYPTSQYSFPPLPTQNVIGTGELYSETTYDESNNIIQSSTYDYYTDFSQIINAAKVVSVYSSDATGGRDLAVVLRYSITTGRRLLTRKVEMKDGIYTSSYFKYSPNHNNAIQTTVINSKGLKEDDYSDFTRDMYVAGCAASSPKTCQSTYVANNDIAFQYYVNGLNSNPLVSLANQDAYTACYNSAIVNYNTCVQTALSSANSADKLLAYMTVNGFNTPLQTRHYSNGIQTAGDSTVYTLTGTHIVPAQFLAYENPGNIWTRRSTVTVDAYDKVLTYIRENDIPVSYVWAHKHQLPIAEVKNAAANQIFFTGFEEETANISQSGKTGRQSYAAAYTVILPSPGTYKLSYWSQTGGAGWVYNESTVSANTVIGGAGLLLDDVRLFPPGAMMTTYTYDVGIGMTSVTDPNNQTTYYQYDSFGRLSLVKDFQGNILKEYKYNYKQ